MKKSKQSRREWWNSLSPEKQHAYIEKVVSKKMKVCRGERLANSSKDMVNNCDNCVHGVCGGCEELEGMGRKCIDWLGFDQVFEDKPSPKRQKGETTKLPDAGQGNLQRERLKEGGDSTGYQRGIRSFHRGGKE